MEAKTCDITPGIHTPHSWNERYAPKEVFWCNGEGGMFQSYEIFRYMISYAIMEDGIFRGMGRHSEVTSLQPIRTFEDTLSLVPLIEAEAQLLPSQSIVIMSWSLYHD